MTDPFFDKEQSKDASEYKLPDQIIVGEEIYSANKEEDFSHRNEQEEPSHADSPPKSLRVLCFLGLIFCCIYSVGVFLLALIASGFAILAFLQSSNLNKMARKYWKSLVNTLIAGFGFALGLLFPPIGLGFLVIYFSLKGEKLDTDILSKIIKRSFER